MAFRSVRRPVGGQPILGNRGFAITGHLQEMRAYSGEAMMLGESRIFIERL